MVTVKQTGKLVEPPDWVLVDLIAPEGDEVLSTAALRNDNLYLVGVTNADNAWKCFAGTEELIEGCTPMGFNSDYNEQDGMMARESLTQVELGRAALGKAVHDFRAYGTLDPAATTEARMKVAMATAAIIISESSRFTEVRDLVRAGWETRSFLKHPGRLVFWSKMTCGVAGGWEGSGLRKIEEAFGVEEGKGGLQWAVSQLNVAIYAKGCEKKIDALV
jgi:hypothetical protein